MTRMTVNGEAIHYKLDPDTPLLWALREASNLTGTKYGCDSRDCGACTAIHNYSAGPAVAAVASVFRPRKVRRFAQRPQQGHIRVELVLDPLAVDRQPHHAQTLAARRPSVT